MTVPSKGYEPDTIFDLPIVRQPFMCEQLDVGYELSLCAIAFTLNMNDVTDKSNS
ncbi:hypothetical protein KI387_022440 [Taxus chinensis]|uniref:Uncharacterized protein n=1 Tax=Taxus chinensis TaxID=29808 RepID=A0AA38G1W7_TAXCH|nr:hypothetical protein KI387_022440 [Taxus chinensis]